jgi:hypothetical protein
MPISRNKTGYPFPSGNALILIPAFHPKALNTKKKAGLLASLNLPAFSFPNFKTMALEVGKLLS